MCRHQYTGNYSVTETLTSCPYSEWYQKWTEKVLPHDSDDFCLFHSKKEMWKRENSFEDVFTFFLHQMNQDESITIIDFRECVLLGSPKENKVRNQIEAKFPHYPLRETNPTINLESIDFEKEVIFTLSHFIDAIIFTSCHFKQNVTWYSAKHDRELHLNSCQFGNAVHFDMSQFKEGFQMDGVRFEDHTSFNFAKLWYVCELRDVTFTKSVNFIGFKFLGDASTFCVYFNGYTNFEKADFDGGVNFEGSHFFDGGNFVNVRFRKEVYFDDIKVENVLFFSGSSRNRKMFEQTVSFDIKEEDIDGKIIFQNINFNQILEPYKTRLVELSRKNLVEIGSGCIRYRHKLLKNIAIGQMHKPLGLEIAQAFVSYFNLHNTWMLGVEIIDKSEKAITVCYFTDEDIEESEFLNRLSESSDSVWEFLKVSPLNQEGIVLKPQDPKTRKIMPVFDAWMRFLFCFFRIGILMMTDKKKGEHLLDIVTLNKNADKENHIAQIQGVTNNFITIFGSNNTVVQDSYKQLSN